MVGTPDGNAGAERARPRSGRGAVERGDRLCRKPGARHSWGDEPRYTLKKIEAYGVVADSGTVPLITAAERGISTGPSAAIAAAMEERPKGASLKLWGTRWPSAYSTTAGAP